MLKEIAPGKTNKNLCLVIFVSSQEPNQGQPCLHKKFRLSFKQALKTLSELPTINEAVLMHYHDPILSEIKNKNVKNFLLKFVVFTALKITVNCIGVFAYVDKIIGN